MTNFVFEIEKVVMIYNELTGSDVQVTVTEHVTDVNGNDVAGVTTATYYDGKEEVIIPSFNGCVSVQGVALSKQYQNKIFPVGSPEEAQLKRVWEDIVSALSFQGKINYLIAQTVLNFDNVLAEYNTIRAQLIEDRNIDMLAVGDKMMSDLSALHTFVKENIEAIDFTEFTYTGKNVMKSKKFNELLELNRDNEVYEAMFISRHM